MTRVRTVAALCVAGTALCAAISAAAAAEPAPVTPPPEQVAPGVHLLRGAILPGRGPDGNTVIFAAPQGLVVVDTGRHAWHSDAILAFARAQQRPVAAIANTHWHLDHSSGNGRIKAVFPQARVYTTNAIDRVLGPGGFLIRNLEAAPQADDPKLNEIQRDEVRIFRATMAESRILRPDVVVRRTGPALMGGKRFDVHVTDRAVTDADVWLYDRASGIAVLGDLVTLPAPFFETACPAQWRVALDQVWAVPFRVAIPGHGEPMTRVQFDTYRGGFNAFMDCVGSTREAKACAALWEEHVRPLLRGDDERRAATQYAEYYVGMLRANGGKSRDCLPNPPRG